MTTEYKGALTDEQAKTLRAEIGGALARAFPDAEFIPFALLFATTIGEHNDQVAVQSISNVLPGPLAEAILKISGPLPPSPEVGFLREVPPHDA